MSPRGELPLPWTTNGGGLRALSDEMCGETSQSFAIQAASELGANSIHKQQVRTISEPTAQAAKYDAEVESESASKLAFQFSRPKSRGQRLLRAGVVKASVPPTLPLAPHGLLS